MKQRIYNVLGLPSTRAHAFFRDAREDIARINLRFLRLSSTATFVLLLIGIALAFVIIDGWRITIYHILFMPSIAALCIASWLVRPTARPSFITAFTVLFEIVLYGFIICIDTVASPAAPCIFTQLTCVALPAVFVLPPWLSYGILLGAELTYFTMTMMFKTPFIAQYDIFQMVAGLLFALCVSQFIMSFRLNEYELRMKYEGLSTRDTLSNIYNKRAFYDQARAYLERTNPVSTCSFAFIDLDDFKGINDTFGHRTGDEVLKSMGDILCESFRPQDIICRFGGDEFLVLLDGLVDERIIRRRFSAVLDRYAMATKQLTGSELTCSIGVISAQECNVSLDSMVAMADIALYEAKDAGKNSIVITLSTSLGTHER
ncbi:diguanylate cyclase [Collinsella tanakaei]|nr:diguanylate cyclase [Collinsella tanakaei]